MSPPEPAKRLVVAALAAPAVLHLALVLHAASRHAAVFDEVVYPSAGYAYWTTGDYRLNREHPPVLKLLTGAAWLGSGVDVRSLPGWDVADEWSVGPAFLYGGGRSHRALLWRARLPVALLSVAAMVAVFAAARRLAGPIAALAAAAVWALDPLVITHAGLATTDLGGAALLVVAVTAGTEAVMRGGRVRIAATGLATGLALGAKVSNLVAVPLVLLAALATGTMAARARRALPAGAKRERVLEAFGISEGSPWRFAARTAIVVAIAAIVGVASYGPAGPGGYLDSLRMLGEHGTAGHPAYAFGHYGDRGWWWYFPAAWLVKTPIPLLAITAAGWLALLLRVRRDPVRAGILVLAPALVGAGAVSSSLNLGVRHLLPAVPFLAVGGGIVLAALWGRGLAGRIAVALSIAWLAIGTIAVHPHEIAYANEAAGGPRALWTKLSDSNVDWGQALPDLAERVAREPLRRLYLGYFGTADPAAYGLRYHTIPSMRMIPRRFEDGPDRDGREWIAISVTNLLGVYTGGPEGYAWLRRRPMTAFPGWSIALYDITGDAAAHTRLGALALARNDPEAAVEPLRRALALRPEDAEMRALLATAEARLGR